MTIPHAVVIAIDGPSGAGKGTVARALAARLAFRHIDTGAMYRAVAWKARHSGLDLGDERAVAALAQSAAIDLTPGVVIDGHDVTDAIRTPEMDQAAAVVARLPAVRAALVVRQRAYRAAPGIVVEGRDIGSVVFPDAEVKLYLDAAPEERARRRSRDVSHAASRHATSVADVASALDARDHEDRTRAVSPLTQTDGAIYIDTTGVSVEAVVEQVLALVHRRLRADL